MHDWWWWCWGRSSLWEMSVLAHSSCCHTHKAIPHPLSETNHCTLSLLLAPLLGKIHFALRRLWSEFATALINPLQGYSITQFTRYFYFPSQVMFSCAFQHNLSLVLQGGLMALLRIKYINGTIIRCQKSSVEALFCCQILREEGHTY